MLEAFFGSSMKLLELCLLFRLQLTGSPSHTRNAAAAMLPGANLSAAGSLDHRSSLQIEQTIDEQLNPKNG